SRSAARHGLSRSRFVTAQNEVRVAPRRRSTTVSDRLAPQRPRPRDLHEYVRTSRITRRWLLGATGGALLSLGHRSHGVSPPRVAVVFNNVPSDGIAEYRYYKAFVRGLRARGLEEGRDLVLLPRSADGEYDR